MESADTKGRSRRGGSGEPCERVLFEFSGFPCGPGGLSAGRVVAEVAERAPAGIPGPQLRHYDRTRCQCYRRKGAIKAACDRQRAGVAVGGSEPARPDRQGNRRGGRASVRRSRRRSSRGPSSRPGRPWRSSRAPPLVVVMGGAWDRPRGRRGAARSRDADRRSSPSGRGTSWQAPSASEAFKSGLAVIRSGRATCLELGRARWREGATVRRAGARPGAAFHCRVRDGS